MMIKEVTLWGRKFDIRKTHEIELTNIEGIIPRDIGLLENLMYLNLSRNKYCSKTF